MHLWRIKGQRLPAGGVSPTISVRMEANFLSPIKQLLKPNKSK